MNDYSQHEEQRQILEFFKDQKEGVFWDIGAGDGVTNSNTRALSDRGWQGVLFEPLHASFCRLVENYAGRRASVLNLAVSKTSGLSQLLCHPKLPEWSSLDMNWTSDWSKQASIQLVFCVTISQLVTLAVPDFLSIDTEGFDADILESAPDGFTPRLIVAEIDKTGARDRIDAEMKRRNYTKLWETVGNAAYERET